jgi:hypothetical protein
MSIMYTTYTYRVVLDMKHSDGQTDGQMDGHVWYTVERETILQVSNSHHSRTKIHIVAVSRSLQGEVTLFQNRSNVNYISL